MIKRVQSLEPQHWLKGVKTHTYKFGTLIVRHDGQLASQSIKQEAHYRTQQVPELPTRQVPARRDTF
jgi:hypothetical protein